MKIKTADLIGPALDWAVAKIDQPQWSEYDCELWVQDDEYQYSPSTIWSQGGLIIEREWIELQNGSNLHPDLWGACKWSDTDAGIPLWEGRGPTPLIAAMRCFVASRLGDEVDVPDELVNQHEE